MVKTRSLSHLALNRYRVVTTGQTAQITRAFGLKIPAFLRGDLRTKIIILSTDISCVGNLQLSVRKLLIPAPNRFNCNITPPFSVEFELSDVKHAAKH